MIEVKVLTEKEIVGSKTVEKVGVGEIFITAGQSNSTNCGDTPIVPWHDTVSAWTGSVWRHAFDPQPICGGPSDICSTDPAYGGSPWSRLGDILAHQLGVPIGFISVGYGGTSVEQWLPGGLYGRLKSAITDSRLYGLRAILWHQGETDSIAGTSTSDYAGRLTKIIEQSRIDAGWEVPWGVALAAYLPQTSEAVEAAIRAGQLQVANNLPSVFQGPNTDSLGPLYRFDTVHFNLEGLLEHAFGWCTTILTAFGDFESDRVVDMKDLLFVSEYWLDMGCYYFNDSVSSFKGKNGLGVMECRKNKP